MVAGVVKTHVGQGAGVTNSTNVLTFPAVGFYKYSFVAGEVSCDSADRSVDCRLRNTTAGSTVKAFVNNFASDGPTGDPFVNCVMRGLFQITDITDDYEIQFAAEGGTVTFGSEAHLGETFQTWNMSFEYLGT